MGHNHHTHNQSNINRIIKDNKKLIVSLLVLLIVLTLAFVFENRRVSFNGVEYENNIYSVDNKESNIEAIITIIDGEGEKSFTETWGEVIKDGYPICSNLVIDYVGREGYMNWETIEALNRVGVEFIFHTCKHDDYNLFSLENVIDNFKNGINEMEKHKLNNKFIVWTNEVNKEIYDIGSKYFNGGFAYANGINTVLGEKSERIKMQYRYDASNYSYSQLIELINQAIENNGWIILFTRNNSEYMTKNQIKVFKHAFEYAKKHNVAVVTASEGYDLYYKNR